MNPRSRNIRIAALLVLLGTAPAAVAADHSYDDAWTALQELAGTWQLTREGREGPPGLVTYHVTSRGSVVFEEFVGKTPGGVRNMATAYHLDGDELVATHYCGAGNQPRMKATSWDPESRTLRFDFLDITHHEDPNDYYTTNIELQFVDDGHAVLRFRGRIDGEMQAKWAENNLKRLTSRPHERETKKEAAAADAQAGTR